jgi:hypothetical protein
MPGTVSADIWVKSSYARFRFSNSVVLKCIVNLEKHVGVWVSNYLHFSRGNMGTNCTPIFYIREKRLGTKCQCNVELLLLASGWISAKYTPKPAGSKPKIESNVPVYIGLYLSGWGYCLILCLSEDKPWRRLKRSDIIWDTVKFKKTLCSNCDPKFFRSDWL